MLNYLKHPEWLKVKAPTQNICGGIFHLIDKLNIHTVCESACCPNRSICFSQGTVTFMILGDICTRSCAFCAVRGGRPSVPDPKESEHIVEVVKKLGLKYVVITSVTRDDLDDGGASHFATVVKALRYFDSHIGIEVLIPDFHGSFSALKTILDSAPSVLNHNVETVSRLYPEVRQQADYYRSIELLARVKELDHTLLTKSGLMLGLGEEKNEVLQVMDDLREAGCDFLTIGQYLQPSLDHYPVTRYVTPAEFSEYEMIAEMKGFKRVASAPLVRSSFRAAEMFEGGRKLRV